ncbi:hypothetical protein HZS55_09170 [Halosimplex rubrum]|uniref:Uncharacterized protein n=1 Tax=Halosimplex rubrum TaxID=869889 RepID=A0A7D5T650_9EURY|nr:HK97-gp10 family putative phage morphogenesis protein [Halosimplex rubrum]QLH77455.1 hypothetical protein HZS55_09170 [Halosimplex rubrum]
MSDIDLELDGLDALETRIEELQEDYREPDNWFVGTAVEYAIFLEFGTSKMDAKPFVRPAVHAYQSNLEAAIATDTRKTLDDIDSAEELVQTIAFGLERRIKRIITAKGLIETGTMRASVKAVDNPTRLPDADQVDPGDAVATADVEVSADA